MCVRDGEGDEVVVVVEVVDDNPDSRARDLSALNPTGGALTAGRRGAFERTLLPGLDSVRYIKEQNLITHTLTCFVVRTE